MGRIQSLRPTTATALTFGSGETDVGAACLVVFVLASGAGGGHLKQRRRGTFCGRDNENNESTMLRTCKQWQGQEKQRIHNIQDTKALAGTTKTTN